MNKLLISSIFSIISLGGVAQAAIVNMTPVNDGKGTLGSASDFAVVNGTISISNSGLADILLDFNYRATGSGGPSSNLGQYAAFGVNLSASDLLLQVGSNDYGIAIVDHSGAPNGGNASLFSSETHADFYQGTSMLTAQTVLNNPSNVTYRNNSPVWLGGTLTNLGALTETVTYHSGATPDYVVELTGQLPASFITSVNSNGGFLAEFGSATCANGYMTGSLEGTVGSPTPEPLSMVLMGSGLVALGTMRRKTRKQ